MQVLLEEVAPITVPYSPEAHIVHNDSPCSEAYLPCGQSVHEEATVNDWCFPSKQYKQLLRVAPVIVWYIPIPHAVQLVEACIPSPV